MNKLDLTALLERVRNATGPDRELNAEIATVLLGYELKREPLTRNWRIGHRKTLSKEGEPFFALPEYTASIDAALALVERVLPGWGVYFRRDKDTCGAGLVFPKYPNVTPGHGEGASLPLAILTALLLALTSNQEGNDEA